MNEPVKRVPNYAAGVLGGFAGAALGAVAFWMLLQIAVYGMVLPGALVGLGCGAQARGRSVALGIVSALMALLLSCVLEWHFFPWDDHSISFFIENLGRLTMRTKLTVAAGTFAGFWFGRGR